MAANHRVRIVAAGYGFANAVLRARVTEEASSFFREPIVSKFELGVADMS
jgi:hypothetical protein